MRQLQEGLKAHLANDATTTCYCWRVQLADGRVLGFTEHDNALSFDGTLFLAGTGFAASTFESEAGLAAQSNEVIGGFSSDAITESELAAGAYNGARVEVFLVNWAEPGQFQRLSVFEIGEVSSEAGAFRAELRSVSHRLSQPKGRRFIRRCDAELGDAKCRFNLQQPGFSASGTISAVANETRLLVDGNDHFPDGFLSFGSLRFVDGALAGQTVDIEVNARVDGLIQLDLWLPLAREPAIGDGVSLFAGCDKSFATCRSKFANQLNFRGFPHIPGADFAYSYVRGDSVHDGSVLIK